MFPFVIDVHGDVGCGVDVCVDVGVDGDVCIDGGVGDVMWSMCFFCSLCWCCLC